MHLEKKKRKGKSTSRKKNKNYRRGTPSCQPTQMQVFFIVFFQEQYKVLISKPVADKKEENRISCESWGWIFLQKNDLKEQVLPLKQVFPSADGLFFFFFFLLSTPYFVLLNKCFWVPITENSQRNKNAESPCFFNSTEGLLQSLKKKKPCSIRD